MRLFGKIDNVINRYDRAWLFWPPFDLNIHEPTPGPYTFQEGTVFKGGVVRSTIYNP